MDARLFFTNTSYVYAFRNLFIMNTNTDLLEKYFLVAFKYLFSKFYTSLKGYQTRQHGMKYNSNLNLMASNLGKVRKDRVRKEYHPLSFAIS